MSLVTVILSGRIRLSSLHNDLDFRIRTKTRPSIINHSRKMLNIYNRKIRTTIYNDNIIFLNFHNNLLFLL